MKRVDVLLATYNGELYLRDQIESILSQTYKNILLLIRDDNSSDNTLDIIKEYVVRDSRVKLISDNLGNLGYVKNFEQLLLKSDSDYIMFSDQDDIWFDNKVETLYNEIIKMEECYKTETPLLVHTNSQIMNFEKITKNMFISDIANSYNLESSFFYYFVQGSTLMINKKMREEAIEFPKEAYLHDRYIHLIADMIGKRKYLSEAFIYYRQHNKNQIGSKGKNIFKRITHERYFLEEDRILINTLYNKYKLKISENNIKKILEYLEITDIKKNRYNRFFISLKSHIPMKFKKKIFLLIKG